MVKMNYPTQSPSLDAARNSKGPGSGVVGLVLCGGAGRRMGGRDKGLLTVDGQPAVSLALSCLEPLCESRFISANRNILRYQNLELGTVLEDLRPALPGPLAGIEALAAALAPDAPYDRLLLLPCDMPRLTAEVPERLLAALDEQEDKEIIYASCGGQAHYLCAALRVSVLDSVSFQLDNADYAVRRWYARRRSAALRFSDALGEQFLNMNSAEDLGP
ncbi:molybdenum cofactor guanylyltransferase [Congregibacter litoralis]|uniref:Molybdenum cofactor guanylyltransferase n=1 Tax=Congregibacter litoralis KT71 TaxID=314285 RepID=A4A3T8_9GAMM|nr:molybdenum cofactor guanylyltransferase [Congregibacter litoralis]EAQ99361.2 molybdenum cofactor guanylyltransferase [Congregibacter litoralis KT71]